MSQAPSTPTVTEDDIAHYLLTTPDFFTRHAQLLASIQLTHPHSGRAISLADRQMELQRERYRQLELKQGNLLRLGKENVALAQKLHQWMLGLLAHAGSPSTDETKTQLCRSLESIFDVPCAVVDMRPVAVNAAVHIAAPICGLADSAAFKDLDMATCLPSSTMQSIAVIPLPSMGLLILASPDPARFTADMGTEFLTRLGELAHAALHA